MKPFAYAVAGAPADAVRRISGSPGARFLGGGTNLVDLMRLGVESPDLLVDVTRLDLDRIEPVDGGGVRIGAGVRNSDLAADPRLRVAYPMLSQALLSGASGQLRNLATVGGNLLQRTRCPYFQDVTKPCNKRSPGSGCPARTGVHRDLAILGASEHCIATHPSDFAVALAAIGARVHVTGPAGDRTLKVTELYRSPGEDPSRDTVLDPADLITAVELPPSGPAHRTSLYRKARDRASYAFAVGSVAAGLGLTPDGEVGEVRIALGAVAHKPWRARLAEAALTGRPATVEEFRRAAGIELAAAEPLPDNAFKVTLSQNLIVAALLELAGGEAR
ncbi:xanthine dehydrogenase family protein subunit M [Kineosporia sp. J2-2]|uniref:Xanthine dehydrogenase family protein subunit M n=1 Tax=Kineosporia corallincola TaxID=2835133 RepID=A0ABS5TJ46_9ACTN|nr:xanthine dehydrogenase family protein subunit M [Kineosporia corallincola]MBT0769599.1 xanthine dehydrogenase family protein subunit M [Kineosporia corallincola]